eukprot:scaffold11463_cov124-Isochrysis_galbana.AAC.3
MGWTRGHRRTGVLERQSARPKRSRPRACSAPASAAQLRRAYTTSCRWQQRTSARTDPHESVMATEIRQRDMARVSHPLRARPCATADVASARPCSLVTCSLGRGTTWSAHV